MVSDSKNPLTDPDQSEGVTTENNEKKSKKQKKPKIGISYFKLFRFADRTETFLTIFGVFCSALVGAGDPLCFFLFGDMLDDLGSMGPGFTDNIYRTAIWFTVLGAAVFLVGFLQVFCLHFSAIRQTQRIRRLYFEAVLRQNIAWFDEQSTGALLSQLSRNIDDIEKGIGHKLGLFTQYLATFIAGIVIGLVKGWKLTLVAMATIPLNLIAFGLFAFVMQRFSKREALVYSEAGAIAGEVLPAIRTVVAFGGEEKEHQRYVSKLGDAEKVGIKKSAMIGAATGFLGFVIFASCALIFWYGVKLTIEDNYDIGAVFIVFFNLILGSIALGSAMPNIEFFAAARASAVPIFETIDRVPPINKESEGRRLAAITGAIEFRDVSFVYESRPDVKILKNFNLKVKPGQTIALVGPSGSGKSTIIHMLQRYYDAASGEIFIDNTEIRQLDLKWYRSRLGVVQQEPVLFAGTVADNISMGLLDATREQIEKAAKLANAHDFICKLPEAYDTWISEGGGSMSGGQKQRIAIARALVRDPEILLLDEATSALDTRSERQVQTALDQARTGRTVIVIAHRLTTVRDADCILVIDQGHVRESGTHQELLKAGGLYAKMLEAQGKQKEFSDFDEDENEELYQEDKFKLLTTESQEKAKSLHKDELEAGSIVSIVSEADSVFSQSDVRYKSGYAMRRMMKYSKPEVGYTIGGCIGAIIAALVTPGFVLLYGEIFGLFTDPNLQQDKLRRSSELYSGLMVVLAVAYMIGMTMEGFFFGVVGERLTRRLRDKMFYAMLRQEIGWFDRQDNQPGVLTTRLATEASMVRTVSGFQLSILLEGLVLFVSAFVIGFADCWQVTLLLLAFVPFIVLGGYLEYRAFFEDMNAKNKKSQQAQIAQEAFMANRTVTTLGLEQYFCRRFNVTIEEDKKKALRKAITFSLMHALARSVNYFAYATGFPLGAYLMEKGQASALKVFRAFSAVTFSFSSSGRVVAFIPDMKRAADAAKNIIKILDRESLIPKDEGFVPEEPFDGRLVFKNVKFRYPTRRQNRILRGFSHIVEADQTHALVGQSGCGKSTVLQLVLRFYDATNSATESEGIFINGRNSRHLSPEWIRRQIGLVSQEPNLFNLSVRDNIAFGANYRETTMDEIILAAKQANIHDFISTLPEGYDTLVGERGSQLSGGQKQRVAIARALIRQPRLLLLDEATSALDNESERVVQAALDEAMGERTCLMIAHRLTTVERSDQIVVLEHGRLVEQGTASQLMAAKGAYYALHAMGN